MRGYVFVYSIHHISFLKKEVERKRWILYFLINVRKCEKKNLLEKNEFIETSSIKFGEMFFFPLLYSK